MTALAIPSPAQGVWHLGIFPLRAYALCIITGILIACWLADRRLVRRGGPPGAISDIALWAVPFGILGGRLYHVLTDPELYFGAGRNPWNALAIWNGGLGIWGAVALDAIGAWVGARRTGVSFVLVAEAVAPALPVGQAIGRWGNWFNQELFGRPTNLPWGLQIAPSHRPAGYEAVATFHPTFLYESLWDLGVAAFVWWVGSRLRIGGFRLFAVYVAAYTVGRGWIEYLRIDKVNHIFGLRLNDWTSLLIFTAAVSFLIVTRRKTPTVEPAEAAGAIND